MSIRFKLNSLAVAFLIVLHITGIYTNLDNWDWPIYLIGFIIGLPAFTLWWTGRQLIQVSVMLVITGLGFYVGSSSSVHEFNRTIFVGIMSGFFAGVVPAFYLHLPRSYLILSSFYRFDNNHEKADLWSEKYIEATKIKGE